MYTLILVLILIPLGMYLYMLACYVMYAALMNMRHNKDKVGSTFVKWQGKGLFAVGLLMDVILNIFVYTLLFIDPPREWLATARMTRYKAKGGWRGKWATWICKELLNPLDNKGSHC